MITPAQCRAARALIQWSQEDLAEYSGIGVASIRTFETGARGPFKSTLKKLREALEKAGIEFIPENGGGPGVRLHKRQP